MGKKITNNKFMIMNTITNGTLDEIQDLANKSESFTKKELQLFLNLMIIQVKEIFGR